MWRCFLILCLQIGCSSAVVSTSPLPTVNDEGQRENLVAPVVEPAVQEGKPFTHIYISETPGPADGAATELCFCHGPIKNGRDIPGDYVHVGMHGFPETWTNKSIKIKTNDLNEGWCSQFITAKNTSVEVKACVIKFGKIKQGVTGEGEYDITLSDGKRVRGKFQAKWMPKREE
jgi:hypothetical protein